MPVGTSASVKSLDSIDLTTVIKPDIILANTYHLYLRPGDNTIQNMGKLHNFTNFKKSFLTDSGGFQAFSLSKNMKLDNNGIFFKSHIDGSSHYFTPKKVIDIQYNLGSDIMMVLDDLVALPSTKERVQDSVKRTTKWAEESLIYHRTNQKNGKYIDQNIFGIIQGGIDNILRKQSAEELTILDFDGFAIGGLSVGESNEEMYKTVEWTIKFMPSTKPRYLMGVGTPKDLIENISRGVDMFDCVMPTRNARNGTLFTSYGKLNIKSSRFKMDSMPIDDECECLTCKNYSKSYLNHLFRSKEISYFRLATIHNLFYYLDLMAKIRKSILLNQFKEIYKEINSKWQ